jgi:hypothetical protein
MALRPFAFHLLEYAMRHNLLSNHSWPTLLCSRVCVLEKLANAVGFESQVATANSEREPGGIVTRWMRPGML